MAISIDKLRPLMLNVGLARHDADWNWQDVRSPFTRLYYVVEGEARVILPTQVVDLRPGYLYLIPPFTRHSYVCTGRFAHYYIHIYEDLTTGLSLLGNWNMPVEVEAEASDPVLLAKLCRVNPLLRLPESNPDSYDNQPTLLANLRLNRQRPFADRMESRGILLVLLSRFMQQATPRKECHDDRIAAALGHIRLHLDSTLSIDELASVACMSGNHFIRRFRQETGQTPMAYVTARKMEAAELLLVTTSQSVKLIAGSLGYDDNSYFVRLFHKHTGLTPQQYRLTSTTP